MKFLAILLALALPPAIYLPTLHARHDTEIRRADAEIRELDTRIEQAYAVRRKTQQFRDETARIAVELEKLRAVLPPRSSIDAVRALTEDRAEAHGVQLT